MLLLFFPFKFILWQKEEKDLMTLILSLPLSWWCLDSTRFSYWCEDTDGHLANNLKKKMTFVCLQLYCIPKGNVVLLQVCYIILNV